ncbi:MAG: GNAT family N-acetyltransferase [Planctomycetes bacterium]|nr:GNAT family N-acetyltransferase [Planctomycetota bacterium]
MSVTIRRASAADVDTVLLLIQELAEYEREPEAVSATREDLLRDGFAEVPLFTVDLAVELAPSGGEEVLGMALYFANYSTWEGRRGIYLEELYVRPPARRRGIGKALVAHLAAELKRTGGARLDLSVLDWNQPARDFYAALGFNDQATWRSYRLTGEALARQAGS